MNTPSFSKCTCGHFRINHWKVKKGERCGSAGYTRQACGIITCNCKQFKRRKEKISVETPRGDVSHQETP